MRKQRSKKEMVLSCNIETVAPESKRRTAVRGFRNAVMKMDGTKMRVLIPVGEEDNSGTFARLSDDTIVVIMRSLLLVPNNAYGLKYFDYVDEGAKSIVSISLTCARFAFVMSTLCPEVQVEALARKSTRVLPQPMAHHFTFTRQMRNELLSCDHLKMIRAAQASMTLHCANECCRNVQRSFNKDIRKGLVFYRPQSRTLATCAPEANQLLTVADNCTLIDANNNGDCAFMFARERLSKVGVHGDARGRRFRDTISRVELVFNKKDTPERSLTNNKASLVRREVLDIESDDMSDPLTLKTSECGKFVAFIRAKHDVGDEPNTYSCVFLWHTGWERAFQIEPCTASEIGVDALLLSAQDVFFRSDLSGNHMVTVAWSTDFYHSSGHCVGSNAPALLSAQYLFSSYVLDTDAQSSPEHYESTFAEKGSLLTCHPFNNGNQVVTLTKRYDVMNGNRCIYNHNLIMSTSIAVTSLLIRGGQKGPVASAVSPAGDCIVVICKVGKSVTASISWKTGQNDFTPVAEVDVSPWVGLYAAHDASSIENDLVKASVELQFSPCGRFVALLDRHPFFGMRATSHGMVVIDTAMRGQTSKFRPYPMFATEEQAPRSFQWTRQGIWLQPPGANCSLEPCISRTTPTTIPTPSHLAHTHHRPFALICLSLCSICSLSDSCVRVLACPAYFCVFVRAGTNINNAIGPRGGALVLFAPANKSFV